MFENRMRHVVDGVTPRIQPSIFLLRILVWLPISQSPALPAAIGLNSIEYVHHASNAGYGKEDDSAVIKIFSASLYRERNHDQDWRYRR